MYGAENNRSRMEQRGEIGKINSGRQGGTGRTVVGKMKMPKRKKKMGKREVEAEGRG